jgi:2-polyprenyl-3-methyl-5-hydroxy-6-metoxy-1,4-benzoquinol methylase
MINHWDEKFKVKEYVYGTEPNDFLKENLRKLNKGDALSLGEGEGRNAVYMSRGGFSVHGVDYSLEARKKAMNLADDKNVTISYELQDLTELDLKGDRYDTVVSIWCHLPSSSRRELHQKAVEALKPGGTLLLEGYAKAQLGKTTGGPQDEDLLFSKAELEADFKDLEIISCVETERQVLEGQSHTGLSSVIQLIAQRP